MASTAPAAMEDIQTAGDRAAQPHPVASKRRTGKSGSTDGHQVGLVDQEVRGEPSEADGLDAEPLTPP